MAYSFGRQFRRIAAEAITADPDEMRARIKRILPPRDDGTPPVLRLKREADRERAPAVIVAAFFADAITGDEAADLLRKTEDPAFRKQPPEDPGSDFGKYGPISLDPEWRRQMGLPPLDREPEIDDDYPRWGPPISHAQDVTATGDSTPELEEYRALHTKLVARWEREATERRSAAKEAAELVKNNENTSVACCDAAENIPEHPPPPAT